MSLRLFSLFALLACAAAAVTDDLSLHQDASVAVRQSRAVKTLNQDYNFGHIHKNDRDAYTEYVSKPRAYLGYQSETKSFSINEPISRVQVKDLLRNGKNGKVTLKSGGPGHTSVTLKFKSKFGGKIYYKVILWARGQETTTRPSRRHGRTKRPSRGHGRTKRPSTTSSPTESDETDDE